MNFFVKQNKKQNKPLPKTYVFVTVPVVVVLTLGAVLFVRVLCMVVGGVRAVLTRVGMLFVVVRGMRAILTLVVMTVAVVMIVVLLKIIYLLFIIKLAKYLLYTVRERNHKGPKTETDTHTLHSSLTSSSSSSIKVGSTPIARSISKA